jgi:hypothetical protein
MSRQTGLTSAAGAGSGNLVILLKKELLWRHINHTARRQHVGDGPDVQAKPDRGVRRGGQRLSGPFHPFEHEGDGRPGRIHAAAGLAFGLQADLGLVPPGFEHYAQPPRADVGIGWNLGKLGAPVARRIDGLHGAAPAALPAIKERAIPATACHVGNYAPQDDNRVTAWNKAWVRDGKHCGFPIFLTAA